MATWLDYRTIALGLVGDPSRPDLAGMRAWGSAREEAKPGLPAVLMMPTGSFEPYVLQIIVWHGIETKHPPDPTRDLPTLREWFPSMRRAAPRKVDDPRIEFALVRVESAEWLMAAAWDGNERPEEGEPTIPALLAGHTGFAAHFPQSMAAE